MKHGVEKVDNQNFFSLGHTTGELKEIEQLIQDRQKLSTTRLNVLNSLPPDV